MEGDNIPTVIKPVLFFFFKEIDITWEMKISCNLVESKTAADQIRLVSVNAIVWFFKFPRSHVAATIMFN